MMRKLVSAFAVFLALTMLSAVAVNAEESETQGLGVVISFERALQMSLNDMLALQDLDVLIREMRMQHRDLDYQFRRLESGAVRRETLAEFNNLLATIDMGIAIAAEHQTAIGQQIDTALGIAVDGLRVGERDIALAGFRASFAGVAGQMTVMMQADELRRQRAMVVAQMQEFDAEFFRNATDEARRGLREIERQIENVAMHQNIIRASLEYALRGLVVVISELTSALEIFDLNMALMDENLLRVRLSYELGMISSHEMLTIEINTSQGHAQLSELRRARERVIQNLNLLIDQPFNQYTVIEFETYVPEVPEDLDAHIRVLVLQAPSIRQLHNATLSSRADRRAFTGNDRAITISASDRRRAMDAAERDDRVSDIRTRIALQEAVERSDLEYEQGLRSMEFSLRQAFNELTALTSQLETAYRELALAESTLNISLASLYVGRITQFEASQAELAVATAKQNIDSIYYQLWILAFGLRHPDLL